MANAIGDHSTWRGDWQLVIQGKAGNAKARQTRTGACTGIGAADPHQGKDKREDAWRTTENADS